MDKAKARDLFETTCQEVGEDVPPPRNWQRVGEKTFLAVYCGVVFTSGFKARIVDVRTKPPKIERVSVNIPTNSCSIAFPIAEPKDFFLS